MEEIKDIEHVRPEYPENKVGRPKQKLSGEIEAAFERSESESK